MSHGRVAVAIVLAVGAALTIGVADAAGPWKGQVLDAEGRQPLAGVVVLMYWTKYTATPGGWAGGRFVSAEEVVTGADGRFAIPSRSTFTLLPFLWKIKWEMVMFKPGYGPWRLAGEEARARMLPGLREEEVERLWNQFERGGGVVFELPRLRTPKERLDFYYMGSINPLIPSKYVRRLEEARESERRYLGLGK